MINDNHLQQYKRGNCK